ncbi:unnamed protein product [Linum tenue]|uniref:Transmembrane protein n=1 Tax=Linum tenue TaxID=586396 RepID=A0AAV0S2F4_9ROSI|nr:unnamed protein product [Linum tenue]
MAEGRRAVTHEDLAPSPGSTDLGSRTAISLVLLTVLCGLLCFALCLIAEASRSQDTWDDHLCVYSGSGETPLMCGAIAFIGLAVAMVVEHTYLLFAASKAPPPALLAWDPNYGPSKDVTWQAGAFFISTWVCFAVAEILLLIGLSVESGHLKNWATPKQSCLVIREGVFAAAGVFSLFTVLLAGGLYLTAFRAQRISQDHETARRQIIDVSVLYASPPRSPPRAREHIQAAEREDPIRRQDQADHLSIALPPALVKQLSFV